ncbi:hypothetical protein CBL_04379 [Carabus blaptoides fortunei]
MLAVLRVCLFPLPVETEKKKVSVLSALDVCRPRFLVEINYKLQSWVVLERKP